MATIVAIGCNDEVSDGDDDTRMPIRFRRYRLPHPAPLHRTTMCLSRSSTLEGKTSNREKRIRQKGELIVENYKEIHREGAQKMASELTRIGRIQIVQTQGSVRRIRTVTPEVCSTNFTT